MVVIVVKFGRYTMAAMVEGDESQDAQAIEGFINEGVVGLERCSNIVRTSTVRIQPLHPHRREIRIRGDASRRIVVYQQFVPVLDGFLYT